MHPQTFPAHFTKFSTTIEPIELPKKFTYPFYYKPHPLALAAAQELQSQLLKASIDANVQGRMYGVLVVKNNQNELGYLNAISGANLDTEESPALTGLFVPQVYDGFYKEDFFTAKQAQVNNYTSAITAIEHSAQLAACQSLLSSELQARDFQIQRLQQFIVCCRKKRKQKRALLEQSKNTLSESEFKQQSIALARESVTHKKQLAELKQYWLNRVENAQVKFNALNDELIELKKQRKKLSSKLQKQLFKQYQLLNIQGQKKNVFELFSDQVNPIPPAGTGDCAAPKLLQYAFEHQLEPICLAEFWWGLPPKSEIRQHQNFYPACQGKCQPLLEHMLSGMEVDENPLLDNPAENKSLEIVYQDEHLVVVNKPADFLSVPGKSIQDSVYSRIKALFPQATGPMIVHRLDMATSGLLMLSLSERAHKSLQKQFINKEVCKTYVALIDGLLKAHEGEITLPLRGDLNDRPRQLVCWQHGKPAKTRWQVISYQKNQTKVNLYPITGRTHQLRVHCAHSEGLNMPIIGDGLYGKSANRLHLHAQSLSFKHPISNEPLTFNVDADF